MRTAPLLALLLVLAGCAMPRAVAPLSGRIWDSAAQRFVGAEEAERRVAAADFALLGETHDNAAHHEIQRRLLDHMIAGGKRPALVMEPIDVEWQPDIDRARKAGAAPADIARAGRVTPGWEWPLYEPLVALALENALPIVAANLPRARMRQIATLGYEALGRGEFERLALDRTGSDERRAATRRLLVAGHCGEERGIDAMIEMQHARDAVMADRILATGDGGAVAIVGRGHARADLGVPLYLRARAPAKRLVSVGLVEVDEGRDAPLDYPEAAPGVHDLVWFTPATGKPDPCAS